MLFYDEGWHLGFQVKCLEDLDNKILAFVQFCLLKSDIYVLEMQ